MKKKIEYRFIVLRSILPYADGVKRFFMLNLFISILLIGLEFITPFFYKLFIDEVIMNRLFYRMLDVVAGYLGIFLVSALLRYLQNYSKYKLVNTVVFRVKSKMWQGLFQLPFEEYERGSIGDRKMKLEDDTAQIEQFAAYQTIDYFIAFMTLWGSLLLLFFIDWRLALFSTLLIPITMKIDDFISKNEKVLNDRNRINDQNFSSWLHASVQGWKEVKALHLELSQERKFIRFLHNFALHFAKWINYWTTRVLVMPKIKDEFFMQFGLYFIGGLLIIGGDLRISELLVFILYYGMYAKAIRTVSATDADMQSNRTFTDRLLLELGSEVIAEKKKGIPPNDSNIIQMENVCFTYPNTDKEVLHNFNLRIEKGERVAITGKSGSGKTTVLKLITGMLLPSKGVITFSGIDLNEIDMEKMHSRIGFVMQENMLFNTTIRENLLYGKSDATDDEIWEACRKAYIDEMVMNLPEQLDTVIGERGIKLSGGQRQRIVLARLFLRDVDVFIFDEATSALDQYSEKIVYDAIHNIASDKTIIVVAHRESSISLCGRKIELKEYCI